MLEHRQTSTNPHHCDSTDHVHFIIQSPQMRLAAAGSEREVGDSMYLVVLLPFHDHVAGLCACNCAESTPRNQVSLSVSSDNRSAMIRITHDYHRYSQRDKAPLDSAYS